MHVVLHFTKLHDGTELALAQERVHHRTNNPPYRPPLLPMILDRVYCRRGDPHAYGDSLARLWKDGEAFINIEQDVAPWPGALTQMWDCPEPWCALPLIVHGCVNERNLGCVKFAARFISAYPDLWSSYPRNNIWDWRSLDAWLYKKLEPRLHHRHLPPAIHLNPVHVV